MKAIDRTQTKDYIANLIKKEILHNRLKDGEELVQETVAAELGVSRMPIREAFQTLELEGFLQRMPNRHMVVRGVTPKGIQEIFRLIEHMHAGFVQEMFRLEQDFGQEFSKIFEEYKNNRCDEIRLLNYFSEVLDNLYMQLLHEKLLDGYVVFVLEDLGMSKSKEIDIWTEVESAIRLKDQNRLNELFHAYFTGLANAMIEKVI
ncbi:GntR family transcriptional regulator [Anaerobium acetethylicum]|uniref:Regulatory protein, gntR family n=1 Tax=Anaerobium acetethylicum TaxID=1619234 RepID=A0A1D3TVI6_9FIRM|nr:GntR family transcriptional regulator [Anaerobium acetethylicum]SCP98164.1 regulatory protein, gntR family [Anaerobium acetethylicum]